MHVPEVQQRNSILRMYSNHRLPTKVPKKKYLLTLPEKIPTVQYLLPQRHFLRVCFETHTAAQEPLGLARCQPVVCKATHSLKEAKPLALLALLVDSKSRLPLRGVACGVSARALRSLRACGESTAGRGSSTRCEPRATATAMPIGLMALGWARAVGSSASSSEKETRRKGEREEERGAPRERSSPRATARERGGLGGLGAAGE